MKKILRDTKTTMEELNYNCSGCGTNNPPPGHDENNKIVYWFRAPKGTRDFWALVLSDVIKLKISYISTKTIPKHLQIQYDYYCINCLFEDSKRLINERRAWETFL